MSSRIYRPVHLCYTVKVSRKKYKLFNDGAQATRKLFAFVLVNIFQWCLKFFAFVGPVFFVCQIVSKSRNCFFSPHCTLKIRIFGKHETLLKQEKNHLWSFPSDSNLKSSSCFLQGGSDSQIPSLHPTPCLGRGSGYDPLTPRPSTCHFLASVPSPLPPNHLTLWSEMIWDDFWLTDFWSCLSWSLPTRRARDIEVKGRRVVRWCCVALLIFKDLSPCEENGINSWASQPSICWVQHLFWQTGFTDETLVGRPWWRHFILSQLS